LVTHPRSELHDLVKVLASQEMKLLRNEGVGFAHNEVVSFARN
jgi:hypothetical protein